VENCAYSALLFTGFVYYILLQYIDLAWFSTIHADYYNCF